MGAGITLPARVQVLAHDLRNVPHTQQEWARQKAGMSHTHGRNGRGKSVTDYPIIQLKKQWKTTGIVEKSLREVTEEVKTV